MYLYHENQDAGLCAVHALNSLLQGRYFTEVDLMHIAQDLDKKEKEMMMAHGTETPDFLKYMAEDSGNVAEDGNYSIQVISQALTVFGIACTPISAPENKEVQQTPTLESAFLCNLASHWLAIRNVSGSYWNFNSLLEKPQHLSDFYLSAFLDSLIAKGYSVFCIRGDLPISKTSLGESGNWKFCLGPGESGDPELAAAIRASLVDDESFNKDAGSAVSPIRIDDDSSTEDEELMAAIAMSMAGGEAT